MVYSVRALGAAVLCVCAAFIVDAAAWCVVLRNSGVPVTFRQCAIAHGKSVFGKYIPGKVWAWAGRAALIAAGTDGSLRAITVSSFELLAVRLWIGTTLGALGLVLIRALEKWGPAVGALWLLLTAVLFAPGLARPLVRAVQAVRRREGEWPAVTRMEALRSAHLVLLGWVCRVLGFQLLVQAVSPSSTSPAIGLGFALATSIGVMAVICPGGLGVREGILAGYLVLAGLGARHATSVALFARLWTLVGETFILFTAIVLSRVGSRSALPGTMPPK